MFFIRGLRFLRCDVSFLTALIIVLFGGSVHAQSMTAMEIGILCGGIQSLNVESQEAEISADGRKFRVQRAQGQLEIYEGGTKLAEIKNFTQEGYNDCVERTTIATRDVPRSELKKFNSFVGTIFLTDVSEESQTQNSAFEKFLEQNENNVVYVKAAALWDYNSPEQFLYGKTCKGRASKLEVSIENLGSLVVNGSDLTTQVYALPSGPTSNSEILEALDGGFIFSDAYEILENELSGPMRDLEHEVCSGTFIVFQQGEYSQLFSGGSGLFGEKYNGFYRVVPKIAYNVTYWFLQEASVAPDYWAQVPRQ